MTEEMQAQLAQQLKESQYVEQFFELPATQDGRSTEKMQKKPPHQYDEAKASFPTRVQA
ncbi:MAG: hypothetical protein P9L91_05155 [Candidatus Zophobacter franzmannii]|nr:hypothetical protein [Candidatus Zophobacter franzmannii]